jgi:hypothetical protein
VLGQRRGAVHVLVRGSARENCDGGLYFLSALWDADWAAVLPPVNAPSACTVHSFFCQGSPLGVSITPEPDLGPVNGMALWHKISRGS